MAAGSKIKIFVLFAIYFMFFGVQVRADADSDKIAQLKAQIEQLEQQKAQLQNTIAQTAEQASTLKEQIQNLKNQINALQIQIQLTGKKIDQTSLEITGVTQTISDTQTKIDYQKATIAQLLLYLSKRDQETLAGVLLKSVSLSDYFSQEQYALTVNSKLLSLIGDLRNTEDQLSAQKTNLESKKKDLVIFQQQQNAQKASLASVQADTNNLLKVTKGQEVAYQKMLADVQAQENAFFSQLRELETRVIQGGLYIVRITASPNLPTKKAGLFQKPKESYRITQGYGCTSFARCGRKSGPYNGAPHNGVDMATGFGTPILAIGDGTIVANGSNEGWGNWVAIQHPNQYNLVSLYAHMSALSFLQVGTAVKAGDVIGYEGNTGNAEGTHLHLSLYKEFFTYVSSKEGALYFNYFEGTVNPLNYL